jgi:photosystem II stability/assembly factor-like uncharacterized protein
MARATRGLLSAGGLVAVVCAVLMIVAGTAWAAAGWTQRVSGSGADLAAVTFSGADAGWAVGAAGTILHTTDGGAVWTAQTTPPATPDLTGVAFVSASDGWAVGAAGTILHTSNGGTVWTAQTTPPATPDLSGVAFAGASAGWAVGVGGAILHTGDGGVTWAAQTSGTTQDLTAVACAGATTAWVVGAGGTILHTTDGNAWAPESAPIATPDLSGVTFAGATAGWAVGAGGAILHTGDGGATWAAQTSPTTQGLAAVAFADARRGCAVGAAGVVLQALNAGAPDSSAPVSTATGLQPDAHSGWRAIAQTITLSAADGGSGVAAISYRIDGAAAQAYAGPFSVASAGSHVVTYWAVDRAGNAEAPHTGYVNIDSGRPTCVAVANLEVRPGTRVTFTFRIKDPLPSCGKANVKIAIRRGAHIVKAIRLTGVSVNARHAYRYLVHLPYGSYTWVVTANDLAGNAQRAAGTRKLRVVTWVIHSTADVQRCLAFLRYLPSGAVTGRDDYRTQQALLAFQAWTGLTRNGLDDRATRARLEVARSPKPRKESASGHYAEVFRSLGVLLCVNDGKLVRVVHCSTGRPSLPTPAGHFSVYMKALDWWTTEYLDWMPFASFFSGGDAIHGFPDVPAYPASHGCVRVSMPEAAWVYSFLPYGAAVCVY